MGGLGESDKPDSSGKGNNFNIGGLGTGSSSDHSNDRFKIGGLGTGSKTSNHKNDKFNIGGLGSLF